MQKYLLELLIHIKLGGEVYSQRDNIRARDYIRARNIIRAIYFRCKF
jgi:hypothetical protein